MLFKHARSGRTHLHAVRLDLDGFARKKRADEAHAKRPLARADVFVPAALRDGEQILKVDDTAAIISNDEITSLQLEIDVRRICPAGVLREFREERRAVGKRETEIANQIAFVGGKADCCVHDQTPL
ncbi:hypothetical protein SB822_01545 [Paraburkholderia sp. SIMBA_054]